MVAVVEALVVAVVEALVVVAVAVAKWPGHDRVAHADVPPHGRHDRVGVERREGRLLREEPGAQRGRV